MRRLLINRLYAMLIFTSLVSGLFGCNSTPSDESPAPISTAPEIVLSETAHPTNLSTPTVQVELTTMQQSSKILELMSDNSGCRLPCWWGIQPGETTWHEANDFLEVFASKIDYKANEDDFSAFADFYNPPKEITSSYMSLSFSGTGEIIQTIKVTGVEGVSNFLLPQILTEYGQPGEVWINTFSSFTDASLPFTLFLFYPELGIMVQYDSDANIDEESIHACLKQASVIRLWTPNQASTFSDILKVFDVSFDGTILSSDDAFEMSTDRFYQNYKDNVDTCFDTSKMKWLGIDGNTPKP